MTKYISKKMLCLFLTLALVLSMGLTQNVYAANGPSSGENAYSYIYIEDGTSGCYAYCFNDEQKLDPPKGVSYSKKTNTLTLNKFSSKDTVITANEMGDDFKVKVTGTCNIKALVVWGFGYGGSLTLTGTGTLNINKVKTAEHAITLNAETAKAKITVNKTLNVNAYAPSKKSAFYISSTSLTKNGIIIKGKMSVKNTIKKEKAKTLSEENVKLMLGEMTVTGEFPIVKNSAGEKFAVYTSYSNGAQQYSIYSLKEDASDTYVGTEVSGQTNLSKLPSEYKYVTKTTKYYNFYTSASTLKIKAKK